MTKEIQIKKQTFLLHFAGAMFWKEEKLLIISDFHLGKVSHFRKHGSAVPQKAISENFRKLQQTIQHFNPKTICFLGDLFHSSSNREWNDFESWAKSVDFKLILIKGNHDLISPLKYEALKIQMVPELKINRFLFTHFPEEKEGWFNFCGHVHPGIKLNDVGRQALKLPCFFQRKNQLILPAFGEFTGNHFLQPGEGDKVYVIAGEDVILVHD